MQEKKKPLSGRKKFFIGYFALLILALTCIGLLRWLGYNLIETGTEYFLFGVLLCSGMLALTFHLSKRFERKWARQLTGVVGVAVTFVAALVMIVAFTILVEVSLPGYYNSFTSENGKTVVVMSRYSTDAALREARSGGELKGDLEELGLTYTAYPRALRFFYKSDLAGSGKLEIGYASQAQLMYEWIDENTFHLFIQNPQIGDEGENTLRLN